MRKCVRVGDVVIIKNFREHWEVKQEHLNHSPEILNEIGSLGVVISVTEEKPSRFSKKIFKEEIAVYAKLSPNSDTDRILVLSEGWIFSSKDLIVIDHMDPPPYDEDTQE